MRVSAHPQELNPHFKNRKGVSMPKAELQAKIDETKILISRGMKAHAFMKKVNKYFRKNGTCRGFPGMEEEKAVELNARANNTYANPFSRKDLEESNYELGKLKERLMELQDQQT